MTRRGNTLTSAVSRFDRHWGSRYQPREAGGRTTATSSDRKPAHGRNARDLISDWNQVAIDAAGLDHTPIAPGDTRTFGEQLGPGRASRAIAIVHIAIFDAVNAIAEKYESFMPVGRAPGGTSMEAAIVQAAHDSLVAMYPSQAAFFGEILAEDLSQIPDRRGKDDGLATGARAAALILADRAIDGAHLADPKMDPDFIPQSGPGWWRMDPVSQVPIALGVFWGQVRPFVMLSPSQFRVPPPPAMESAQYALAFNEVKRLGGDGLTTATDRTQDQTDAGLYWAYDGTPSLCAPPRLYNQIARQIADEMHTMAAVDYARLLALINVAMADAGVAIWESKYHYQVWRPITAIRESEPGTGPSGDGDGNDATIGDTRFMPLGAPASNLHGPNFTPPFPAYPSGHAGFGGALFQVLRRFYGTDEIRFTFVSDELNGITRDNTGFPRPLLPRTFNSLSEAEEENGQSRIYLGIHFAFDKTEGIRQGRQIADYVIANAFVPTSRIP
jgi:hypothetical protein